MPANAEPIVAQIRHDMQALVDYVTAPDTATQTAYTVELTLFRRLLALGAQLLRLFFLTRVAVRPSAPQAQDGTTLSYYDQRLVTYFSVFGKFAFPRHSFRAPAQPACCPVDAKLSLPERCYSDLLRDWTGYDATDRAYRETTVRLPASGCVVAAQPLPWMPGRSNNENVYSHNDSHRHGKRGISLRDSAS